MVNYDFRGCQSQVILQERQNDDSKRSTNLFSNSKKEAIKKRKNDERVRHKVVGCMTDGEDAKAG